MMSFADLRSEILEQDMCARCGACVAVCPPAWLSVSDDGPPQPLMDPAVMACEDCTLCLDVCPGRDTATPPAELRLFGRTRTASERWTGIYRESLLLTSIDPRIRASAAAGGAGSSLLLAALRSGLADAVIVVGRDPLRPWVPLAVITGDEEELVRCAQTSYCLTPNLQLLRDERYSRVAVIGVPCEIQAIRKMEGLSPPPAVAGKIVLTIEVACASNTRRAGTEFLIEEKLGIRLEDVAEMRYRDGEYPGEFAVTTRAGERRSLPFFELVDEFKRFKTHRCLTCGDWWSGLADISISDGDPNIYASSRNGDRPSRQSIVMVRTERGQALVTAATTLGLVRTTPAEFVAGDNLGLQRKRFRYASFAQAMPGRVPTPPVAYEEPDALLSDAEVIDRMSSHAPLRTVERVAGTSSGGVAVELSSRTSGAPEIHWTPPGDKSISQRVTFAAALADGTSTIHRLLRSEDVEHNLTILRQLGVDAWEGADGSFIINGRGLAGLTPPPDGSVLDAGNSATTARILIGLLAGTPGEFRIDGNRLLRHRPMAWVVEPLRRAGAAIDYEGDEGRLPVRIRGCALAGITCQADVFSAQQVSALLFAGLQSLGACHLRRRVRARDHTERLLRHLGVRLDERDTEVRLDPPERLPALDVVVPGDLSAAALAIACVVASPLPRRLVIENVGLNETRSGFVRTLQAMGAAITIEAEGDTGGEPSGRIVVESGRRLQGVEIGGHGLVQSMIDELPLLAAVAARAKGRTVIRDAGELKDKDTDRIATTVQALTPFGVRIERRDDGFAIDESRIVSPGALTLPPDHRVVFAAMTLACSLEAPTRLSGWERVRVSFPDCLDILGRIASVRLVSAAAAEAQRPR